MRDKRVVELRQQVEEPTDYAEISGVKVAGQVVGSGPPVLLLHGFGGSHNEWLPLTEHLTQYFKLYLPTFPGHGPSGPIPGYSLETARELFSAFLECERLEKVTLVGQSMGGLLALEFALSFPDRIEKLVLVDSAGLGYEIHWGLRILSLPILGEFVIDLLWKKLNRYLPSNLQGQGLAPGAEHMGGESGGSLARLLRTGVSLRGQKFWRMIAKRLPALKVPTLIIWGESDPLFPVSQAYNAHRLITGSKLHVMPGCGHCPNMEKPVEFNRVLVEFLLSSDR